MMYIDNILFAIILVIGIGFFAKNVKKLKRNINLGHDVNRKDNSSARWKNRMAAPTSVFFTAHWNKIAAAPASIVFISTLEEKNSSSSFVLFVDTTLEK